MNQQSRIVLASTILILSISLLILNPSMLTTAQAQMYNDEYRYDDKHPKKSSDVNIQKIKCVNSNVNLNGIDITQIPQDGTIAANKLQQMNKIQMVQMVTALTTE